MLPFSSSSLSSFLLLSPLSFHPSSIPSLTLSSEIYEVWTGGFLRATEGRSTHFGYPEYVCYQLLRITKLAFEGRGKPIIYNLIECRCRFLHLPYNYYHTHSHVHTHIHTHKVLTL